MNWIMICQLYRKRETLLNERGGCHRKWVKSEAQRLKIFGIVRNLPDGRVEIIANGGKKYLEELVNLIQKGPKLARVKHVNVIWEDNNYQFDGFEIKK
jgi:acylphosphatase